MEVTMKIMNEEELTKARQICDHCCAPFSEVSDEHVAEAMKYFYMSLEHIDYLTLIIEALKEECLEMKFREMPSDPPCYNSARRKAVEEVLAHKYPEIFGKGGDEEENNG
jgi:hypothetical protein